MGPRWWTWKERDNDCHSTVSNMILMCLLLFIYTALAGWLDGWIYTLARLYYSMATKQRKTEKVKTSKKHKHSDGSYSDSSSSFIRQVSDLFHLCPSLSVSLSFSSPLVVVIVLLSRFGKHNTTSTHLLQLFSLNADAPKILYIFSLSPKYPFIYSRRYRMTCASRPELNNTFDRLEFLSSPSTFHSSLRVFSFPKKLLFFSLSLSLSCLFFPPLEDRKNRMAV